MNETRKKTLASLCLRLSILSEDLIQFHDDEKDEDILECLEDAIDSLKSAEDDLITAKGEERTSCTITEFLKGNKIAIDILTNHQHNAESLFKFYFEDINEEKASAIIWYWRGSKKYILKSLLQ